MTPTDPAFWHEWLCSQALPLWSSAGYDAETGSFVERLALDGTPQADVPRRLMTQARQIHVYATAVQNDWFPEGADLALRVGDAMIERYHAAGGAEGWAFSCTGSGGIADGTRDLYAHAFVLLALAGLIRLDPKPRTIALVHTTLAFLDREMAHPAGGYIEQWPSALLPRRQNPHMHLVEALLALQETGVCGDFSERLHALITLFDQRFFSDQRHVLSEYFDEHWHPVDDGWTFEPGHHFEWVWLLKRTAACTGTATSESVARLLRQGLRGIDQAGRVIDEMGKDGPAKPTLRLWPAMEAAKALALTPGCASLAPDVLGAAWRSFFAAAIPGGWIDRVDQQGAALVDHMPASSLYHICTALDCLQNEGRQGLARE